VNQRRSRVHSGPRAAWTMGTAAPHWRANTRGRRCTLAFAGEDEEGEAEPEAKPEVGSSEHERRSSGDATAAEDSCHMGARARGRARERGEGVRWWWGSSGVYIGG
jgi:hypothetical protein